MSVDITDLFKYGWVLILTIIPKYLTSNSTKFRNLELKDTKLTAAQAAMSTKVTVIDTKLDFLTKSTHKMSTDLESILETLTDLRIEQSKLQRDDS